MSIVCPSSQALLDLQGDARLVCVRCRRVVQDGDGPEGYYWCGGRSADQGAQTVDGDGADSASDRFPGYVLEGTLGAGGGGHVYLARSQDTGQQVALKVMGAAGWAHARLRLRFQREIASLARIEDPGVLPVLDAGTAVDGVPWFAMPVVSGPSLAQVLADAGSLPTGEAVRIAATIAETLGRVHADGVVHRDIKPSNILIDEDGQPLLSDFGLALELSEDDRLTRTEQLVGTPRYMAPEQRAGLVEDWARVDVYALGAVLYEALGGRIDEARPSGVFAPVADVPSELMWMVERATAPSSTDRYATAAQFARDLRVWLEHRSRTWLPLLFRLRGRAWVRRRRLQLAVAAGLVLGVLGVFAGLRASASVDESRREADAADTWRDTLVQIDSHTASGNSRRAEAAFEHFIDEADHQGTRALGEAWLHRAGFRVRAGDVEAAKHDHARALLATDDPGVLLEAADGLMDLYREVGDWRAAGVLLASLDGSDPSLDIPDRWRAEAALGRRDLAGARPFLSAAERALFGVFESLRYLDSYVDMTMPGPDGLDIPMRDSAVVTGVGLESGGLYRDREADGEWTLTVDHGEGERVLAAVDHGLANILEIDGRIMVQATGLELAEVVAGALVPLAADRPYVGNYPLQLISGDLDGDGRNEIIQSMGPPDGFLIEVLDLGPDGLSRRAWRRFGFAKIGVLSTPVGPRLIAMHIPEEHARYLLGEEMPKGGPSRVLVFSLQGDELRIEQEIPLDRSSDDPCYSGGEARHHRPRRRWHRRGAPRSRYARLRRPGNPDPQAGRRGWADPAPLDPGSHHPPCR